MTQNANKKYNFKDSRWYQKKKAKVNPKKSKIQITKENKLIKSDLLNCDSITSGNQSQIVYINPEGNDSFHGAKLLQKKQNEFNSEHPFDFQEFYKPARFHIFLNTALGFDDSKPAVTHYESPTDSTIVNSAYQSPKESKNFQRGSALTNFTNEVAAHQYKEIFVSDKKKAPCFNKSEKILSEKFSLLSLIPQTSKSKERNLTHREIISHKYFSHPVATTVSTSTGSTEKTYHGESYERTKSFLTPEIIEHQNYEPNIEVKSKSATITPPNTVPEAQKLKLNPESPNPDHASSNHTLGEKQHPTKMTSTDPKTREGQNSKENPKLEAPHTSEQLERNIYISPNPNSNSNNGPVAYLSSNPMDYNPYNVVRQHSPHELNSQLKGSPIINIVYPPYAQSLQENIGPNSNINYLPNHKLVQRHSLESSTMSNPTPEFYNENFPTPIFGNSSNYRNNIAVNPPMNDMVTQPVIQEPFLVKPPLFNPQVPKYRKQLTFISPHKYFSFVCSHIQQLSKQQYDWLVRSEQYKD